MAERRTTDSGTESAGPTTQRAGPTVKAGETMSKATRTFFSYISSMQQLCTLFGKDFRISDHCDQQPLPSVALTSTIFGRRQRGELESVAETYHSCFVRVVDPALGIFPPCLSPLLTLMRHCHRTHVSLLSNGAGKLFATYLLNLSFEVGETWAVRSSTTHDSRRDWCRVSPRTGISRRTQRPRDPNIGGVPDILLQTLGGVNLDQL